MSEDSSPVSEVETLTVAVTDIETAWRKNFENKVPGRTHVLEICPPFGGDHPATLTGTRDEPGQLPEHTDGPAYVHPKCFVGYEVGDGPVDETNIEIPSRDSAKKMAIQKSHPDTMDDPVEHEHQKMLDAWRARIENELRDKVRIAHDPDTGDGVWVPVEYEHS